MSARKPAPLEMPAGTRAGWHAISGVASHVRHASTDSGRIQRRNGQVTTTHTTTLRIDGRPAQITLRSPADVNDGQSVTLAGKMQGANFVGYAIRNNGTQVVHTTPTTLLTVAGALLIVAGLPFILFTGVGILLIGTGAHLLFRMQRNRTCADMLRLR